MKKILGLLATAGLIWVGIPLETDAAPIRSIRGRNAPARIYQVQPNDYYPRRGDSFYYEQRVIIERGGDYNNCYNCSYRSPYHSNYNYPRSYNRGIYFYPNSPYSIYNRYNRGY
ncbi:hypothetical protein PCC7424_4769 [Gloeothece citriformis PCC 7424]|uniref:Uncharacterized protein n=1 Tax=Gloeothece citriformis (strain PCC 7424) TaxID=65393 RepID=B7KD07_GLOC7|nr:hypothetical protein [Gloeothece citriformis]ACK73128.1 hypothetical protein PCC7424_4769 [Gloeothece citriformis PCC 7424]